MAKRREQRPAAPPDDRARGMQAFTRGDYDGAISAWSAALRSAPTEGLERALAEAHFRRACLGFRRAPAQALADLQSATELAPDDGLYAYHRGLAYHRSGDLPRAIALYRDALRLDPDPERQSRAAYMLCLALGEQGGAPDQDPAWELLTRAQRERLLPASGAFAQAVKRLARGEYKASRPLLERAAETHRGFASYYLGNLAWRRSAYEEAVTHWNAARAAGFDSPGLRHNLAMAHLHRAIRHLDSPEMAESVGLALKFRPNLPLLLRLKERAEFLAGNEAARRGDWRAALSHWLAARGGNRAKGTASRELLANTALAYERLEEWTQAAETWREVVRRRPRRGESIWPPQHIANLWRHIDDLYARSGQFDRAAAVLGYAIKAQPDDLTLRLALVRRHIENENWRAAGRAALRMLELSPGNPDALALYAQVLDAGGDLDLMIEGWEQVAHSRDPKYTALAAERLVALYAERGDFFELIDDHEAATADYSRAVELCPPGNGRASRLRARYGAILARSSPDLAHAQFEQADLSDEQVILTIVGAWHESGQHDEAARWLGRAGRELGSAFYVELGSRIFNDAPDAAAEYFERATAGNDDAALLTWIAVTLDAHQRSAEAYEYARQALKADPGYGPAHLNLGLWDAARGRRPAANQHLSSALRWAEQIGREDIGEGIEEAINLLAERHIPTLEDILDTIDPDGDDHATRRLLGSVARR